MTTASELADELEGLAKDATAMPWALTPGDDGKCVWEGDRDKSVTDLALVHTLVNHLPEILAALRRVEVLEKALEDAEQTLALSEFPRWEDPQYGPEVRALGERIGFGALMASASASWRQVLGPQAGGEHTAGPCQSTVTATLTTIRQALTGEA
jgi:uncharacterized membrane protein YccC